METLPYTDQVTSPTATALDFRIAVRRGAARSGTLSTAHGTIETPAFVAVGTQATVKGVTPDQVARAGTQVLFANTYHLYLRPGADVVGAHGGLHRFMNWNAPIMTDSGGFQVFSLGASIEHGVGKVASIFPGEDPEHRRPKGDGLVRVEDERVVFKSHIDGSTHVFTPEISIDIQRALGADIVLAFDECTSPLHDEDYTRESAERTHRWARRSLERFRGTGDLHGYPQALYGIVQGGAFERIRVDSARAIGAMGFDGIAIGGNLGKTREDMYRVLEWTEPALPVDKPRHLLGIGDVPSIFEAVERGMDTFDCVSPTRNARNGGVLVRYDRGERVEGFRLNLRNARFREDVGPVEDGCDCATCAHYSRAYLRHLFKANEQLAQTLATIHNLRFMARLCEEIRGALRNDAFDALKRAWLGPGKEHP